MFIVLLAACAVPPTVQSVSPSELSAGQALSVSGARFTPNAVAWIRAEGAVEAIPLQGQTQPKRGLLRGTLPVDLPEGRYSVGVSVDGRADHLSDALSVVPLPLDLACSGLFTLKTTVSLAKKEVSVERLYLSGQRSTVTLSLSDVKALQLEERPHNDGLCSAIYLNRVEGDRVLLIDSTSRSLTDQATRLAGSMARPLR